MDKTDLVPISVEWALHGQESGQRGYRILGCSDGVLSREDFAAIITRFHSGTPEELPQVTLGWAGTGERAHLIMAIQELSDTQDWLGRPLLSTRLFCVSYDQLARRAVGYETLYASFANLALPVDDVVRTHVEQLRPGKLAAQVTDHAMATAALLLSGSRVCLVDGDDVPVVERLRYLDTVAALLPYGMRPYLSASTWTSSTAEHHIRLSFTEHGRDGAHSVSWMSTPQPTFLTGDVRGYLDLLRGAIDPAAVIASLARAGEPLSFRDVPAALEILRSAVHATEPEAPGHTAPGEIEALLESTADAADRGWHEQLEGCLRLLEPMARADQHPSAREGYRRIVLRRRMLGDHPSLPAELALRLYRIVLRLACGPVLTVADVRSILDAVPRPSRQLVDALRRMSYESPAVTLLLERRLGPRGRNRALTTTSLAELVGSVLRDPPDRELIEALCEELVARGSSGGDPGVAEALRERGYLAEAIENLYPEERETQVERLKTLLTAAYGPVMDGAARDRVTGGPEAHGHPALLTAVNRLGASPPPYTYDHPRVRYESPPPSTRLVSALAGIVLSLVLVAAIALLVLLFR